MDGGREQLCGIFSWLCTGEYEKCPEKLPEGAVGKCAAARANSRFYSILWGKLFQRPCFKISALPSGKSNISLAFPQDRYFPCGLWETVTPLFSSQDHEQRCCTDLWHDTTQEQSLVKRNVCSQQRDVANPSPHLGSEWAVVEDGMHREPMISLCSSSISHGLVRDVLIGANLFPSHILHLGFGSGG